MSKRSAVLTLMLLFALTLIVTITGAQENPNANISWPPPVYVLRGEVEVRGTANLPNMSSYFLEFRPLNPDTTVINDDDPWFPATLPETDEVDDDVLGVWDTTNTEDGLYELRLTINVTGSRATFFVVSPLRVENEPPEFLVVGTPTAIPQVIRATPTLSIITRPTLGATPTAFTGTPRVVANIDANVRRGDSVAYERVGSLLAGESADLIGISTSGSGWYYVQLDTGRRGFIAPSLVTVTGDISDLPRFSPPATPTPTPTPTPVGNGDVLINGGSTVPSEPRCGQPYEIHANVTNSGTRATTTGGFVRMQNLDVDTNTITTVLMDDFPALAPGQNFVVVFPLTITNAYADQRVTFTVDVNNQVLEESGGEGNNEFSFTYRLRQANCP